MEKIIDFSGAIYPDKGEAKFPGKIDKQGRISVSHIVRDKLGIYGKEVRVDVSIRIVEVYKQNGKNDG